MIKAVIFDLDNTLTDFMKMKRFSCEEAISAMIDAGLDMKQDDALKLLFDLYDCYGIEYKQIFQEFLKRSMGRIDWKILAAGIVAYRRIKNGYLYPYPHVNSTLMRLREKGIKLAILSDAPRMRAYTRLAALKLSDFFDVVVTYEDTGEYKPSSAGYTKVLEKLGLAAEDVLMIGDWPERDIAGAKKLGIKSVYARYGSIRDPGKNQADFTIDDIAEILDVVERCRS